MQARYYEVGDLTVVEIKGRIEPEQNKPFRDVCEKELKNKKVVFCLESLNFTASATKVGSPLTLSLNALGDASGNSITVYLQDGLVTIEQPSGVPEPSSLLYSILGIFILAVRTRTFRR